MFSTVHSLILILMNISTTIDVTVLRVLQTRHLQSRTPGHVSEAELFIFRFINETLLCYANCVDNALGRDIYSRNMNVIVGGTK